MITTEIGTHKLSQNSHAPKSRCCERLSTYFEAAGNELQSHGQYESYEFPLPRASPVVGLPRQNILQLGLLFIQQWAWMYRSMGSVP